VQGTVCKVIYDDFYEEKSFTMIVYTFEDKIILITYKFHFTHVQRK